MLAIHDLHATNVAVAFYLSKSRQGIGLGGLASRGSPDMVTILKIFFSKKSAYEKTAISDHFVSFSYGFVVITP